MTELRSMTEAPPPSYPALDQIQETLYANLRSIIFANGFCPEQFSPEDLLHDAFLRLRNYYISGINRGNIKQFESWCYVKAWSAARDARRHMLGARGPKIEIIPIDVEREGGGLEELDEVSKEYESENFHDVEWGLQDVVRKVLTEHAKKDSESVAVIILHDMEEAPAVEIAALYHKSERQVRYIVQKDRKSIEQLLNALNITTLKDIR